MAYVTTIMIPFAFEAGSDAEARAVAKRIAELVDDVEIELGSLRDEHFAEQSDGAQALELLQTGGPGYAQRDIPTFDVTDSVDGARAWLREQIGEFGAGFHWDTHAEDYVDVRSGEAVFPTRTAAEQFDYECENAFAVLSDAGYDPYALALEMINDPARA